MPRIIVREEGIPNKCPFVLTGGPLSDRTFRFAVWVFQRQCDPPLQRSVEFRAGFVGWPIPDRLPVSCLSFNIAANTTCILDAKDFEADLAIFSLYIRTPRDTHASDTTHIPASFQGQEDLSLLASRARTAHTYGTTEIILPCTSCLAEFSSTTDGSRDCQHIGWSASLLQWYYAPTLHHPPYSDHYLFSLYYHGI